MTARAPKLTKTRSLASADPLIPCSLCAARLRALPHSTPSDFPWLRIAAPKAKEVSPGRAGSGKWLLFPKCESAVKDWKAIAAAVMAGKLWQAKISETSSVRPGSHLVCVYTPDIADLAVVRDAATFLVAIGVVRERMLYYKPDRFTLTGLYSDSGPASVYGMRAATTYLFKTQGFKELDGGIQAEIDARFKTLPVLPRP